MTKEGSAISTGSQVSGGRAFHPRHGLLMAAGAASSARVTSMSGVSGIGFYSAPFQLPYNWRVGADGALAGATQSYGLTGATFTAYTEVTVG